MTRAQVADLHTLQQLDAEIERVTIEGEALRRALETDPTEPARAALATSERAAEASAARMRQAEATLEDTHTRLKRQEARLYGGQVSAKDLGKAQQEIEHLQALRASQEDALLMVMMDAEEAQSAVAARRQALAEAERARDQDRSDQATRLEQVTARLEQVRTERNQRAAALAPELLARYEALRRSHGGRAVAEVRSNVCSACRVTLTPATLQRARIAGDLPLCDNCGRILYLP
jgi:predicted  nucleic acid-binding Zn-ribbon protein